MERREEFYKEFVGKRQGNIVIRNVIRTEKRAGKIWECLCDCGKAFEATTSKISHCGIVSCPECAKSRRAAESKKQLTKHGLCNTRIHRIWWAMISRCTYKGDTNYHFYGKRGVSVCDEWRSDFVNFYNWAVNNGYSDKLTIERIDCNKGYDPSNCAFIPKSEQAKNRRSCVRITVDGVTRTQQEWAKIIGKHHTSIIAVRKRGDNVENYIRNLLVEMEVQNE